MDGIVGRISGYSNNIKDCISGGKIEGKYAGGISGCHTQNSSVVIKNCKNYSEVYAISNAGGITGYGYGSYRFEDCSNNGKIDGSTSGGIIRIF